MGVLGHLVNFLYPPRCAGCGEPFPLDSTRRICEPCLARVERLPESLCVVCGGSFETGAARDDAPCERCLEHRPAYRKARAVARYRSSAESQTGTLPSLIRRHKYGFNQALGRALAEYLPDHLPLSRDDYDLIVPVPLHRMRLWQRGFNQAALLADLIAGRLEVPHDATAMLRIRATRPQTARERDERRRNVRRAFAVRRPERVAGKRILLIDDVMTTGATVDECARTLVRAGARYVDVFTLARVP